MTLTVIIQPNEHWALDYVTDTILSTHLVTSYLTLTTYL